MDHKGRKIFLVPKRVEGKWCYKAIARAWLLWIPFTEMETNFLSDAEEALGAIIAMIDDFETARVCHMREHPELYIGNPFDSWFQ